MAVRFRPLSDQVAVPIHYNHLLQALIYRHVDAEMGRYLHDQGFTAGSRAFKLFVFSRLFGRYERRDDRLSFAGSFRLYVASPVERFIQSLGQTLLRNGVVQMGEDEAQVEQVTIRPEPDRSSRMVIRSLSPITVYSTLMTPTGQKKTYYYSPFESEFSEQIQMNLRRKYCALSGQEVPEGWGVSVTPLGVRSRNQVIVTFKGTVIKGWTGNYCLEGAPELIWLALEAGLGAKNSQGFGMVRPASDRG